MQERTNRICAECGEPLRVIENGVAIEGRPRWQCEGHECHEFSPQESPGWFAGTLRGEGGADDPGS